MAYKKCLWLIAIFVISVQSVVIGCLSYKMASLKKYSTIIYDYSNNNDSAMFDSTTQWYVAMGITYDLEHALSHADWLEGDYPYGCYYYRGLAYEMATGVRGTSRYYSEVAYQGDAYEMAGQRKRNLTQRKSDLYNKALECYKKYFELKNSDGFFGDVCHAQARCFFFLDDHQQARHYYAKYIIHRYDALERIYGEEGERPNDQILASGYKRMIRDIICPSYNIQSPFLLPSDFVEFMKSGDTNSQVNGDIQERSMQALSHIFDILGCTGSVF
jgi:tetratricopeptide (TPR) repeat protein